MVEWSKLDLTVIAIDSSGSVHCDLLSQDGTLPSPNDHQLSAYFSTVNTIVEKYFHSTGQLLGARWGSMIDLIVDPQNPLLLTQWAKNECKMGTSPSVIIAVLPKQNIETLVLITDGTITGRIEVALDGTATYSGELGHCCQLLEERLNSGLKIRYLDVYILKTLAPINHAIANAFMRYADVVSIWCKEYYSYNCPLTEGFHVNLSDIRLDLASIARTDPKRLVQLAENVSNVTAIKNQFGRDDTALSNSVKQEDNLRDLADTLEKQQIVQLDTIRHIKSNVMLTDEQKISQAIDFFKTIKSDEQIGSVHKAINLLKSSRHIKDDSFETLRNFQKNTQPSHVKISFLTKLDQIHASSNIKASCNITFEQHTPVLLIRDGNPLFSDVTQIPQDIIQCPLTVLKYPDLVDIIRSRIDTPSACSVGVLHDLLVKNGHIISPFTRQPLCGCLMFGRSPETTVLNQAIIGEILFGKNEDGSVTLHGDLLLWIIVIYVIVHQTPCFNQTTIVEAFMTYLSEQCLQDDMLINLTLTSSIPPQIKCHPDVALYYNILTQRFSAQTILSELDTDVTKILEKLLWVMNYPS
jgi:hypothetical protein